MRLAINALEEELEDAVALCEAEDLGLEVTAFAFGDSLDEGLGDRIQRHIEALDGLTPLSSHGPFLDLFATSPDPRIVEVCQDRHARALEASIAVGASVYVAHLNSIPLIRNRSYVDRFVDRVVDFWLPFADEARRGGVTIVLENLWEEGPELQKSVARTADHQSLKASFDNGHALVFSERPASEWIEVLGADLHHCHLRDNDGSADQHLPVGRGIERWDRLFAALDASAPEALVVLESDRVARNAESLAAAGELLGWEPA